MNGIIQHVTFWDWILLLSINTALEIYPNCYCITSSFLFIAEWYSFLWMYHSLPTHALKDIWVVSRLLLGDCEWNCYCILQCVCFSANMFPVIEGAYLGVGLLISPLKRTSKQAKCKCLTKADSPERKMGEIAASKHLFVKWGRVSGGLWESGWKREEIGRHTARPFSSLWHRPQLNGCRK